MSCFDAAGLTAASVCSFGGLEVEHVENASLCVFSSSQSHVLSLFHRKKNPEEWMGQWLHWHSSCVNPPPRSHCPPTPPRPPTPIPPTADDFSREQPRKHRYSQAQECGGPGPRWNVRRRENFDYTCGKHTGGFGGGGQF